VRYFLFYPITSDRKLKVPVPLILFLQKSIRNLLGDKGAIATTRFFDHLPTSTDLNGLAQDSRSDVFLITLCALRYSVMTL
jgi:hypothetical protein